MGRALAFALLLAVAHALPELCPSRCQCDRATVRCLQKNLTTIPKPPSNVMSLDLRFNTIYEIAPGVFSRCHRLRSLLLNNNQLRALRSGAFYGLRRIKYLYLYRNRISHIDPDVFNGLEHLEQLYLHVNEIHEIAPETFTNMPRLERLYLHNNQLRNIPQGSFHGMHKLKKLRLDSNALVCDCAMLWFVRMLTEHEHMQAAATCYAPPTLTGLSLAAMNEQQLHCRQPHIEKEPQDAVISFGDDAMFTCTARGEPAPEIIWFRDSNPILTRTLDSKTNYEIMDNGTLMVHEADENDVGVFECMARNPAGEVRSKKVRMIIQEKPDETKFPVMTVLPRKQVVGQNQKTARFECMAYTIAKLHLFWLFNSEPLKLNDRITIYENGTLLIEDAQEGDVGLYTCVAQNDYGETAASAPLELLVAPAFLTVPSDMTVSQGTKVVFNCTARGEPQPVITWFRNTMPIPPSTNVVISNNGQTLTIVAAKEEDDGIYHCRAENSEGITEISAILKVAKYDLKPKITLKPEDTEAFRESSVQLPCDVESEPSIRTEWTKDGEGIQSNNRISITVIGSLIINNLTLADSGRYECVVYNDYGRDVASAFLKVKDHRLPNDEYVNIALTEATRDVDLAISRTVEELFHNNTGQKDIHELFKIAKYPKPASREIAKAAEIYERALLKVQKFIQSGRKITSAEPFNYHSYLSVNNLDVIAQLSGCVAHREKKNCSDMCFHNKYRTVDGSCNNFENPMWGASLTGFRRILYPIYENGFSQPIGWNKEIKYNGYHLPGARTLSLSLISTEVITEDIEITHMVMQWGQWLDHDLDHSLPPVSAQSWDGVDCKKTCDYASPCFPIDVPADDPRVTNRRCIDFIRTSAVCGSGSTSVLFGKLQPREQINQLTSFLDASQVYGFETAVANDLRDLTNQNGLLRVGSTIIGRKPSLPTTGINGMDCRRNLVESNRNCFVAGDIRANEQIGLAAMHTIWMREHNRIAKLLKEINLFWDGDKIYQEARKVVGAEMQMITYEHWLPIVLGPNVHRDLGEYTGYNPNVNPSISNVFATAALRFGHSLINPILHRYDENFETIPQGHLPLRNAFFAPWRLEDEGGVDPLLRGMFTTPAKLKTSKQNLNSELTEQLFYTAHAVALDLAAINIQRGRDHGLPTYNKWRQFCNMTPANTFDDLATEISDKDVRDKLQELYGTVENIDVWVGGILEDQVDGGKVGPLFRCLLLEQFRRLRDGDRLWYENPTTFKPDQLKEIKKTTLARILCDNGDNIDTIGENVFLLPEVQDGLVSCEDLPTIDFRFWAECEMCNNANTLERVRARRDLDAPVDTVVNSNERFDNLLEMHRGLEKTVDQLHDKIKYLEKSCRH